MKLRIVLIAIITSLAILLAACNFTLAEDVTPPPGYVPPTPMPTLGPLYPNQAPNIENGAAIYQEKCSPCHGATGMGDGPQGIQLGVTVAALGLPEVAQPAAPAQWYATVTRGNIDRFMPPFTSLTDQERWDVVAYALTLHTKQDQLDKGKSLFESNCAACSTDYFTNQEKMSALSEAELARLIKQGGDGVTAFGSKLSDDDLFAVAAYLRSLSFATALASASSTVAPATPTLIASESETPSAEITPEGTAQAQVTVEATTTVQAGFGPVSGSIDNQSGADLPSDLKVTLHIFEHGQDQNAGPQEIGTQEITASADGKYIFENVELKANRIFVAEVDLNGMNSQSDFAVVKAGDTSITVPTIVLHPTTQDLSVLRVDNVHMYFDYTGQADVVQLITVYTITNTSNKTLVVPLGSGQDIPFIPFPEGAQKMGYEPTQDSAQFVGTNNGFAMPPSDKAYGLITISGYPKNQPINISQKIGLPVSTVNILVPQGVKAEGDQLTEGSAQDFQGTPLTSYSTPPFNAGDTLAFTVSGDVKQTSSPSNPWNDKKTILLGVAALGVAIILVGAWMYWRDRDTAEDERDEEDEEEQEDPNDIMDAIIALDDQHRSGKIPEDIYQKRRNELKSKLKDRI